MPGLDSHTHIHTSLIDKCIESHNVDLLSVNVGAEEYELEQWKKQMDIGEGVYLKYKADRTYQKSRKKDKGPPPTTPPLKRPYLGWGQYDPANDVSSARPLSLVLELDRFTELDTVRVFYQFNHHKYKSLLVKLEVCVCGTMLGVSYTLLLYVLCDLECPCRKWCGLF